MTVEGMAQQLLGWSLPSGVCFRLSKSIRTLPMTKQGGLRFLLSRMGRRIWFGPKGGKKLIRVIRRLFCWSPRIFSDGRRRWWLNLGIGSLCDRMLWKLCGAFWSSLICFFNNLVKNNSEFEFLLTKDYRIYKYIGCQIFKSGPRMSKETRQYF